MTTPDTSNGHRHPIGVAVQRTGLTADVIRVWERRYGAVRPGRGPGGQRVYTDADIDRLRLLHAATRAGRSIGQVAGLDMAELGRLVEEDARSRAQPEAAAPDSAGGRTVREALALTLALDASRLDLTLRRSAAVLGVGGFVEQVAAPLLHRVGEEWHAGRLTVGQEHLVSSVLHDIVADTMRTLVPRAGAPRVVIATPAGERHVIGAAAAGAAAAAEGWEVVYLGADLPARDIASAAVAADARMVAVSVVHAGDGERVLAELRELREAVPRGVPVWAGGAGAALLAPALVEIGVRVGTTLSALLEELRTITVRA